MDIGVSIIVPCYNNGEYIKELIDSVRNSRLKFPYEIIIVDDNSKCTEMFKKLDLKDVLVIFNEQNYGVQKTRNIGLKAAKYKYILPLDSDDILANNDNEKSFIDEAILAMENNENIAFVHGLVKMFGDYSGYTISAYPINAKMVSEKHHVQTSILYRREDAIFANGYSEKIEKWQDWSFGIAILDGRLRQGKGIEIQFINMISYLYRIHKKERISQKYIDEYEMIKKTIILYPNFFEYFYGKEDVEDLANEILKKKPSRLIDLLYTANFDINIAKSIVSTRDYEVRNDKIGERIP